MTKPTLYRPKEAAEYLGISESSLRHYMYHFDPPKLQSDNRTGNEIIFLKETLDAFRTWHRPDGYTMQEAANYLGVTYSWMKYHRYVSKKLVPDARSGKFHLFSKAALDAAKESLLKT